MPKKETENKQLKSCKSMENNYFLSSLIYISGFEKSFRKALCAKKVKVYDPFPVGKRVSIENHRIFYISYEGETNGIAVYHYQVRLMVPENFMDIIKFIEKEGS